MIKTIQDEKFLNSFLQSYLGYTYGLTILSVPILIATVYYYEALTKETGISIFWKHFLLILDLCVTKVYRKSDTTMIKCFITRPFHWIRSYLIWRKVPNYLPSTFQRIERSKILFKISFRVCVYLHCDTTIGSIIVIS